MKQHEPVPEREHRWATSFDKCAACGQIVTRIAKQGTVGKWRHLEPAS